MEEIITSREELDTFLSLVNGHEWGAFLNLKRRHNQYLQKQVNDLLAKGEYRLADRAQAKLEENDKDVSLLKKRMDELKAALPKVEDFING